MTIPHVTLHSMEAEKLHKEIEIRINTLPLASTRSEMRIDSRERETREEQGVFWRLPCSASHLTKRDFPIETADGEDASSIIHLISYTNQHIFPA